MTGEVSMNWQGVTIMISSLALVIALSLYCVYHLVRNRE